MPMRWHWGGIGRKSVLRWQNNALRAHTFLLSIYREFAVGVGGLHRGIAGERVFCDVQPTRLWERKARRTLCLFAGIGGGTIEDEHCCVGRFNALRASSILMSITDNYRRF
jgi:hypothetical protein